MMKPEFGNLEQIEKIKQEQTKCLDCKGEGFIRKEFPACEGEGEFVFDCTKCDGEGKIEPERD